MSRREFDALKFCQDYNIEYWTEGKNVSPGWVAVSCPFCGDHSNHGGFNPYGGYYSCWKCGKHTLTEAITALTGIKNAYSIIKNYDYLLPSEEIIKEPIPFDIPGKALLEVHKQYLRSRNFDPDFIEKKYKVLGTTHDAYYPYRIITPVIYNGEVVSFLGRDYTNKQTLRHKDCPINMSKIYHKKLLYDLDNATKDRVLVVEGAYDKWRMGDNTVATLGTGWTLDQLNLLVNRFSTVFIMFDRGKESQEKAYKLAVALDSAGVDAEVLSGDIDEPDHLTESEVLYVKKELKLI